MELSWLSFAAAAGGYLLGSVSFARLVFQRLRPGTEPDKVRFPTIDGKGEVVSHAVGGANVRMAFGSRWGVLVSILDLLKAFVPTLVLRLAYPEEPLYLLVAVAVLAGHLWPVWHRFSGGGGNACVMGMLLAISPVGLIVTHAGGMLIGRVAPQLTFMASVVLTLPWFALRDGVLSPETIFAGAVTLLYLLGQLPEILQVLRLRKQGHPVDYGAVSSMMKRKAPSAKEGTQPGEPTNQKEEENRP